MAIHHLTPPVRGGERPRLPSTQVGPVTQAIRAMRAAEPGKSATVAVFATTRVAKSETISHSVAAEPIKTEIISALPKSDEAVAAIRESVMRFLAERIERDIALLDALDGNCDLEDENEHGGDVQDEPHDPEEDSGAELDEPPTFLCTFDGTKYLRRRA